MSKVNINLDIRDSLTGKEHLVQLSYHDGYKLYKALRELYGDIQINAQPGELITVPKADIKVLQ